MAAFATCSRQYITLNRRVRRPGTPLYRIKVALAQSKLCGLRENTPDLVGHRNKWPLCALRHEFPRQCKPRSLTVQRIVLFGIHLEGDPPLARGTSEGFEAFGGATSPIIVLFASDEFFEFFHIDKYDVTKYDCNFLVKDIKLI